MPRKAVSPDSAPYRGVAIAVVWVVVAGFCLLPLASAKEPSLSGIELYNGSSGSAFVQLTEILINGKIEFRDCTSASSIDKSTYGKLPKIPLAEGSVLERGEDGVLRLSVGNGAPICVVPMNVKFDHGDTFSPSDLADHAELRANVIDPPSQASAGAPPLKVGVKIVFSMVPNEELARFLLAQRASNIALWKDYLARFPAAVHTSAAQQALAALYVNDGNAALSSYLKSASSAQPPFSELKNAKYGADQALLAFSGSPEAAILRDAVRKQVLEITKSGQNQLQLYRQALINRSPGYSHLVAARILSDAAFQVDPKLPDAISFQSDVAKESGPIESAIHSAQASVSTGQFDEATLSLNPYRSFFGEEPRISEIIDAIYKYRMQTGASSVSASDWQKATVEYEKAVEAHNTPEASEALQHAREGLLTAQNKAAAESALQTSRGFEDQHDFIKAYEVLAKLSPAQRTLVSQDMERLAPNYIQSASQKAKSLQQIHEPIKGPGDEEAIRTAYEYLQHALELGGDPSLRDRMENLGDQLSEYYLKQAGIYLAKPAGSGTELGWMYLTEALPYKASNLAAVNDKVTEASAAQKMRSRLSIRVQFRDQTSQRDSAGFASQLEDAVITGLEASGLPVRVVRSSETTTIDPYFQLVGDVLDHHTSVTPTVEALESKYRAGEHEIPNEEWNKANREYESASLALQSTQSALQGAQARGKKKEIQEANERVANAQKKVEDAHAKLDSIPKTTTTDVERPYTYRKTTTHLRGVVQLQFRIGDFLSGEMGSPIPVSRQADESDVLLEDVKPEDVAGIKPQGTNPDKLEFIAKLENEARDELIAQVRKQVADLPQKILVQASKKAESGDIDGAGEAYLLYLNATSPGNTPERRQAARFLSEQFNMRLPVDSQM